MGSGDENVLVYSYFQFWFKKRFIGVFRLKFTNLLMNQVNNYLRLKSLNQEAHTKF